jgi:hypothetical protein
MKMIHIGQVSEREFDYSVDLGECTINCGVYPATLDVLANTIWGILKDNGINPEECTFVGMTSRSISEKKVTEVKTKITQLSQAA